MAWQDFMLDSLYPATHNRVVLLTVGGALGTNARYWLGYWITSYTWGQTFPYSTLLINVSGSFLLAVLAVLFVEHLPQEHLHWFLMLGTGFCGGYTTFSTFEWETFQLVQNGSWKLALVNILGSFLAGFLAVALGVILMRGTLFPAAGNQDKENMKTEKAGKQLTVYLNSNDQYRGRPLYSAIVQTCQEQGIAGATVLRCVEGYGAHHRLHTTRLLDLTENLPVRIEIIDLPERIDKLLAALEGMIAEGLVTVHDVHMVKYQPDGKS